MDKFVAAQKNDLYTSSSSHTINDRVEQEYKEFERRKLQEKKDKEESKSH